MSDYNYSRIVKAAALALLINSTDTNHPQFPFIAHRLKSARTDLTNEDLELLSNALILTPFDFKC